LGSVDIGPPIVIRLDGTNAEQGRAILADHVADKLISEPTMLAAARRAVELAGGKAR
jgi:succinyl-CoA synthetase beta subunit